MKKFIPTFSEIRMPNKDYLYIVRYSEYSTIKMVLVYNSISQGYMGVTIDAFVDSLRGLLNVYPDFLQNTGVDPCKELSKMGFTKREPTEMEMYLYANEYTAIKS